MTSGREGEVVFSRSEVEELENLREQLAHPRRYKKTSAKGLKPLDKLLAAVSQQQSATAQVLLKVKKGRPRPRVRITTRSTRLPLRAERAGAVGRFRSVEHFLDSLTIPDAEFSLGSDEAAERIRASRETVNTLRRKGKLIAFKRGRGWRYPTWQFDRSLPAGHIEGVQRIREALRAPEGSLAFWLVHPKEQLEGRTPLDLLKRGQLEVVVQAAEEASSDP